MRGRRWAAACAAVWLVAAPAAAESTALFRLSDQRLTEVSGIGAGIANPAVFYVHNDGGDRPRFYALDARSGATRATFDVPGAQNNDWEDIAVARDVRGVPSVWLADIGDNNAERDEIQVYRVDEPAAGQDTVGAPDVWHLRYPTGPVDAESFFVGPDGVGYIVTKSGAAAVYRLPTTASDAVQDLVPVGRASLGGLLAQATGADLQAGVLAVRTYSAVFVWQVSGADVTGALRTTPVSAALPGQPQGEAVAVSGGRLVVASERAGSTVFAVDMPARSTPSPTPTATPTATPEPRERAADFTAEIAAAALAALAVVLAFGVWRSRRNR